MIIAQQKRKENIAEFLIYMWQIEDIIRALELDISKIEMYIVNHFDATPELRIQIKDWYESLIEMMRSEGVVENGHLQMNKNIVADLTDLHLFLLQKSDEIQYQSLYFRTIGDIQSLRAKQPDGDISDIELALSALYGMLLMRLKKDAISDVTQQSFDRISKLIATLAQKYKLDQAGELRKSND